MTGHHPRRHAVGQQRHDSGRRDAEAVRDRCDLRRRGLAKRRRRQGEEQAIAVDRDLDETFAALLDQTSGGSRHDPVPERCMGGADGRMAGERQLPARGEDSQPVVSERFVQAAIACICALDTALPSSVTATGFPLNGTCVNTSTC